MYDSKYYWYDLQFIAMQNSTMNIEIVKFHCMGTAVKYLYDMYEQNLCISVLVF